MCNCIAIIYTRSHKEKNNCFIASRVNITYLFIVVGKKPMPQSSSINLPFQLVLCFGRIFTFSLFTLFSLGTVLIISS